MVIITIDEKFKSRRAFTEKMNIDQTFSINDKTHQVRELMPIGFDGNTPIMTRQLFNTRYQENQQTIYDMLHPAPPPEPPVNNGSHNRQHRHEDIDGTTNEYHGMINIDIETLQQLLQVEGNTPSRRTAKRLLLLTRNRTPPMTFVDAMRVLNNYNLSEAPPTGVDDPIEIME